MTILPPERLREQWAWFCFHPPPPWKSNLGGLTLDRYHNYLGQVSYGKMLFWTIDNYGDDGGDLIWWSSTTAGIGLQSEVPEAAHTCWGKNSEKVSSSQKRTVVPRYLWLNPKVTGAGSDELFLSLSSNCPALNSLLASYSQKGKNTKNRIKSVNLHDLPKITLYFQINTINFFGWSSKISNQSILYIYWRIMKS